MKKIIYSSVMLAAMLGLALIPCAGQSSGAPGKATAAPAGKFDLGVMFTYKIAKIATLSSSNFGMPGGSVEGVYWLNSKKAWAKNLGIAFELSGETASNIKPGVNLSQMSVVAGPRYTVWRGKRNGLKPDFYLQGLFGEVSGFNSVFPSAPFITSRASAIALQTGGGFNYPINSRVGFRVAEADYVITKLPNNTDSYQGDLRVSSGFVLHF